MNKPKLSIITVNLNNNKGLIQSITSVERQTFQSYEHIIIDGDSKDGSKETIIKYSNTTSHLAYWTSEPDKGIYDGMNKGIEHANGEYLYFLNSGDCLKKDILQKIKFDGTKYIYGDITVIHDGRCLENKISVYPIDFITLLYKVSICHQACFIHHSLFSKCLYNTEYKIIADWIHIIDNIILKECSYKHIPILVADYDDSGFSSTAEGWKVIMSERLKWLRENIPSPYITIIMQLKDIQDELSIYKNSELGSIIPLLNQTRKFQKRIKKLIMFLYRINSFFSCKH